MNSKVLLNLTGSRRYFVELSTLLSREKRYGSAWGKNYGRSDCRNAERPEGRPGGAIEAGYNCSERLHSRNQRGDGRHREACSQADERGSEDEHAECSVAASSSSDESDESQRARTADHPDTKLEGQR